MMLTRKQMDEFKCGDPECKDPSHELFMHSKCHIDFPMLALLSDNMLELQCAMCGKFVFDVLMDIGYGENVILKKIKCQDEFCKIKHYVILPKCHEAPIWAVYTKKEGILEIRCAKCEKPVYRIAVKKE